MPEFLLAHSTRCVNLVSEDKERYLSKLLDAEESVKLSLAFTALTTLYLLYSTFKGPAVPFANMPADAQ